jgi:hypothetical protein
VFEIGLLPFVACASWSGGGSKIEALPRPAELKAAQHLRQSELLSIDSAKSHFLIERVAIGARKREYRQGGNIIENNRRKTLK